MEDMLPQRHADRVRSLFSRSRFLAFYSVTAAAYLAIGACYISLDEPSTLDLWPGRWAWAAGYLAVGVCAAVIVVLGANHHYTSRTARWSRIAGALATPLLIARAIAVVYASGTAGLVGGILLTWAALVLALWGPVLYYLPARREDWAAMLTELRRIRTELDHQEESSR